MNVNVITHDELDQVKDILHKISKILGSPDMYLAQKKTISVRDVATVEGVSITSIRTSEYRYLLPNFGVSEYPGKIRWNKSTYLKWSMIPPSDRQKMWNNMSKKDRANIVTSTHGK